MFLARLIAGITRFMVPRPSWKANEYFDEEWKERIRAMAAQIEGARSVLDLGCGPMWLKEMLQAGTEYVGCDYVDRGGNLVCDFNKRQFPDVTADVAFVSGCLEYVEDVDWFLGQIHAHCPVLIISYSTMEQVPVIEERRKFAWMNDLSSAEFQQRVIDHGFEFVRRAGPVLGNEIFAFKRR